MRCLRLFLASSLFVLLLAALNNMVFRYRNRTIIGANLANAGDEDVRLKAVRGLEIRGEVFTADGKPAVLGRVRARGPDRGRVRTVTVDGHTFVVKGLRPGTYKLQIRVRAPKAYIRREIEAGSANVRIELD